MPADDRLGTFTPRVVFGFSLIAAGALLLADRLAFLNTARLLKYWPLAVMAVGLAMLRQHTDAAGRASGWTLIGVGGALLVASTGSTELKPWEFFWPTVLVLAGINLMLRTAGRRDASMPRAGASGRGTMMAALGGAVRRWDASPFRGAEMTSVLGGCELDLRQATLAPGEQAVIDVFTVMGGSQIRVPESWGIVNEAVPIMGGIDDRSRSPDDPQSPRLVVRGFILMGGVEIKN